ncbi:sugar nucleotide-binding protein [Candidatus Pelagibacter sp.]|nr:sugar nucleotide-binding protein [Candidatus Pelagibacter sp.]
MIKRRILLLGHKGLLGQEFLRFFKSKKIKFFLLQKKITVFNLKKIISKNSINFIINCAGKTNICYCENNFKEAFESNTTLPLTILSVIKKTSIKFVHFSSEAIFQGNIKNKIYNEKDIPNPKNVYAITKFLPENSIIEAKNTLIIRLPFLISEHSNEKNISKLIKRFLNNEKVYINNKFFSTFVYVPDFINFFYKNCIMKNNFFEKKIIHYSSGENMSLYEYFIKVFDNRTKYSIKNIIPLNKKKNFQYFGLNSIYKQCINKNNFSKIKFKCM